MHVRPYHHLGDDAAVQRLLLEAYPPGAEQYTTWLQPRWEYLHAHPLIDEVDLSRFGVAEDDEGRLLGIVHNEHHPAFAYLQRRPGDDHVIAPLLDWSEARLGGRSVTCAREVLGLYVPTCDRPLTDALRRAGQAGAEVAWVGSDQAFYLAMGFLPRFDAPLWVR